MTIKFQMTRDIGGYNGFGLPFGEDDYSAALAQNVEDMMTVPTNFQNWIAIFNYTPGTTVWVASNQTATVPSSSFTKTSSQSNPAARLVHGGDVLHFITGDTGSWVGVSLYAIS